MEQTKFTKRYLIRCLIGFHLEDLEEHNNLTTAKKHFELIKKYIIENKENNAPWLLFLVDSKTKKIIDQYEEIPTENGKA